MITIGNFETGRCTATGSPDHEEMKCSFLCLIVDVVDWVAPDLDEMLKQLSVPNCWCGWLSSNPPLGNLHVAQSICGQQSVDVNRTQKQEANPKVPIFKLPLLLLHFCPWEWRPSCRNCASACFLQESENIIQGLQMYLSDCHRDPSHQWMR